MQKKKKKKKHIPLFFSCPQNVAVMVPVAMAKGENDADLILIPESANWGTIRNDSKQ